MNEPTTPPDRPRSFWRKHLPVWPFLILVAVLLFFAWPVLRANYLSARYGGAGGRVATVNAEMRNIAVALESFHVYEGRLPTMREYYDATRLPPVEIPDDVPPIARTLTSPVAHLAGLPGDPFSNPPRSRHYYYTDGKICWILATVGPDGENDFFQGRRVDSRTSGVLSKAFPESERLAIRGSSILRRKAAHPVRRAASTLPPTASTAAATSS